MNIDPWLNKLVQHLFRILMAFVLVSGICLLLLSHNFSPGTLLREGLRDLGIAVVISFVVTIVIEYYSAKRREADIRSGILDAIMEKIIPPAVWDEIRSNIIEPAILCETWNLTVVISRDPVVLQTENQQVDQYVATGTLTYTLSNLLNRDRVYRIRHELESDIQGKELNDNVLPRYTSLTSDARDGVSGEEINYNGQALKDRRYWTDNMLTVPVRLPRSPSSPVRVAVSRKEIIQIPGGYPWYMTWVTLNPTISIETQIQGINFDVVARHPNSRLLHVVAPGKVWQFSGVVLPGQGLEIMCRKG